MMYQCSFTPHFHVCIWCMHARRTIGVDGAAGIAESGSMPPIHGSMGKDVFCGINPENPGGLAGMTGIYMQTNQL